MNQFVEDSIAAVGGIPVVPTILEVLCRTTGMGFAAVARVTEDRWIACGVRDEIAFGLQPGRELAIETTICNEIRDHRQAVVIDDVAQDPVYREHHTPARYGFQSYISMPITLPDGRFFGTLCSIDPQPRALDRPEILGMFRLFAELIGFHLDANERLATSAAHLLDARTTGELRDQFVAVLGHDLRNPLASIDAGTHLLLKEPQSPKAATVLAMMAKSVARMSGLIENILDFARGRLGGGVPLEMRPVALEPVFTQVIDELAAANPGRAIDHACTVSIPVRCDPGRIAQLLSNLVGNALTHGSPGTPVRVACAIAEGSLTLSVANQGVPIPAAARERLFRPFERGSSSAGPQGLGLGLYIASEIAIAHDGVLSVSSTPRETCFTFRMPLTTG